MDTDLLQEGTGYGQNHPEPPREIFRKRPCRASPYPIDAPAGGSSAKQAAKFSELGISFAGIWNFDQSFEEGAFNAPLIAARIFSGSNQPSCSMTLPSRPT